MNSTGTPFRWDGNCLILVCHLQPNAKKDEFCGLHGQAYKIRISAPAVDGKANAGLIQFLAKAFRVSKSQVKILSGELSRQKRVSITQPKQIPDLLNISDPPN
ncbi:DUF167 family protein [Gynuella sp.]|uniref:DUF167 family protein n=1 Tax=Gynuella sp. TaxID=2969146 RepID=UPI003D104797